MAPKTDLAFRWTRFYMKIVGFWYATNRREQCILNAILSYTIIAVLFAICVEAVDLYYSWGDFEVGIKCHVNLSPKFQVMDLKNYWWAHQALTTNLCISAPMLVIALKLTVCIIRRDVVFGLIAFAEKNFWSVVYDEFGEKIMRECERKGVILISILSCAVQGTVGSYAVVPLVENVGKNDTDRDLPFRLWIDFPIKETPFYEILFTIQTLSAIHSGICFFCFDNLMGILNIHIVGQFKILQRRFETVCEEYIDNTNSMDEFISNYHTEFKSSVGKTSYVNFILDTQKDCARYELREQLLNLGEKTYARLRECIKQHLVLIDYVEKLEYVFNSMLLCQMGVSSIFICLTGFHVFVAKRWLYLLQLTSSFSQMLLFTWTCNEIIIHSSKVGDAAYRSRWYMLPGTATGHSIRRALIMVVIRAQKACHITAGKFTPISLRSFTAILSTTLSYLSLLRKVSEDL